MGNAGSRSRFDRAKGEHPRRQGVLLLRRSARARGGPTNADCNGFMIKQLIRLVDRFKADFLNYIDFNNFFWLFEKETREYLKYEIMSNPEYNFQFNKYDYDFNFVHGLIELASIYTHRLLEWSKPALLMFGSGDRVTYLSKRHFSDYSKIQNVSVRHISNGCHITPCRKETDELLKFHPFIDFVKTNV